jgi:uncharacterized protein YciI
MLFIAHCTDKPDHVEVRMKARPDHVAFLQAKGDALKLAGPTTAADGETPNGSLILFEDEDLDTAKAWVAGDPYAAVDLFESVIVKPWKHAIGGGL